MGPDDITDMTSSTNKVLSLPKLRSDSTNWATYSERILNYLTSKGYRRHVQGTARKPETLTEHNGAFFKKGSIAPLSDDELEKLEDARDLYDQAQAAVREIIYRTIDKTTFLQIKNEADAASVWKKVASIHSDKGSLYEANLLVQLQNARYTEKESMREHIGKMTELRERLAEMNAPISDESFVAYLRTSLSLAPSFRNLFTTLSTTARQTGKKLTPTDVIWHLTEEATSVEIEDTINKSNAAMMATTSKSTDGKERIRINPNPTYFARMSLIVAVKDTRRINASRKGEEKPIRPRTGGRRRRLKAKRLVLMSQKTKLLTRTNLMPSRCLPLPSLTT
jgi:hypothetical protein